VFCRRDACFVDVTVVNNRRDGCFIDVTAVNCRVWPFHATVLMRALVTRFHFRSRDKDSGYTIHSVVVDSHMLHTRRLTALCLYNWNYCRPKFYIAGIGIFDLFGSSVTLPRLDDLHNYTTGDILDV